MADRWFKAWVIPEGHWLRSDLKYMGAWYDLIGLAEWQDNVKVKRGNMFDAERGMVYMSINALAERWHWTWRTTKNFISMLEKDNMVHSKMQNGEQNVFISNYAKYQDTVQNRKQNTEQSREQNTEQNTEQNKRHFLPNKEEHKEYKEHKKSVGTFDPPTMDEVGNYIDQEHLKVDPFRFWNYYESNGWMVGKSKMKSWQAALRNWNAKDADPKPSPKKFQNFEPRPDGSLMDDYIKQLEEQYGT